MKATSQKKMLKMGQSSENETVRTETVVTRMRMKNRQSVSPSTTLHQRQLQQASDMMLAEMMR
jgi:hypothetical protein